RAVRASIAEKCFDLPGRTAGRKRAQFRTAKTRAVRGGCRQAPRRLPRLLAGCFATQCKSRLAIVVLLRHNAIESDVAAGQRGHAGLPECETQATATKRGLDDVEAEKAEVRAVLHYRDA